MHKVYTPDITIAVENVVVFVQRLAAFAGHLGATKDQGGVGHCKGNSGLRILCQLSHHDPCQMIGRQAA
jgi:hypothetical protein